MLLQNSLIAIPGSRHRNKRVGRGNGSQRGTYSGLGNKGQHSRGSAKIHRTFTGQGGRSRFILGIPKNKGFKSIRPKSVTVTINLLNKIYNDGEIVNKETLYEKGVLSYLNQPFKVVGNSNLEKKLTFDPNIKFSVKAKEVL